MRLIHLRQRCRSAVGAAETWVFLLALGARVAFVLNGGGYRKSFGYDASVYYTSADALLFGRLPYRDYTFVHPPGITLALVPFAALGNVIGDDNGFIAACVASAVMGAVSAALVVRIGRRLQLGTVAATAGGLAYALWPGSIAAEYLCRLEPLGNVLVLVGLLHVLTPVLPSQRRPALVAGAVLAAAVSVKIWWLVPFGLVLLLYLLPARRAQLRWFALAAGAVFAVVDGPFFVSAPRHMVRMIVLDQINRPAHQPVSLRLAFMSGAGSIFRTFEQTSRLAYAVAVVAVVLIVAAVALRAASGWLLTTTLLAQCAVLLAAPSSYMYYDDYLAPVACIAFAVGIAELTRRGVTSRVRQGSVLVLTAAAGCLVAAAAIVQVDVIVPYPASRLARGVQHAHCVVSNVPMTLIMLDVLSRDLSRGCPNAVDLEGRRYGADRPVHGSDYLAPNSRWERDLDRYLLSGDALALYPENKAALLGLSPKLRTALARAPILAADGGYVIYDTRPTR
jgi:hypothetical protein